MDLSDEQARLRREFEELQQRIEDDKQKILSERGPELARRAELAIDDDPEKCKLVVETAAEIIATRQNTPGQVFYHDDRFLIDEAIDRIDAREALANQQGQSEPGGLAQEQPAPAIGTPEYGAQQELLPRDRDRTDINRYAVLDALSDAQRSQENQSSVTAEWQPAAIEVCGSTEIPKRGPDDGQSPNGPTEGPHSPTQSAAANENSVDAFVSAIAATEPSSPQQQSEQNQGQGQGQDILKDMRAQETTADPSREQHDSDLMRDFVSQEVKESVAAQDRQQEFQQQRDRDNSMTV